MSGYSNLELFHIEGADWMMASSEKPEQRTTSAIEAFQFSIGRFTEILPPGNLPEMHYQRIQDFYRRIAIPLSQNATRPLP